MPRRPAKVTQADIARAIRAAKEAGAHSVSGQFRTLANSAVQRRPSAVLIAGLSARGRLPVLIRPATAYGPAPRSDVSASRPG
jgi:hypothetical protein